MFRWINGRDPRQYGRDFGLWTRSVVADLIERKFNIRLGVTVLGALLAKLRLTPQSRCNGPTNAIRKRSRRGGASGVLPLPDRQRLSR
jgi:hypothetical protein